VPRRPTSTLVGVSTSISTVPPTAHNASTATLSPGFPFVTDRYRVRLATCEADLRSAQRLRFEVFNKELNEGLESAWLTGHDVDRFDGACAHLLVEENTTGQIVGTYRMLPGPVAASSGLGYYSAQEFDFTPFEPFRAQILELGRACVHQDHRNQTVVGILWRGIAMYARSQGARYLLGCSSLTSQDPAEGAAVYRQIAEKYLAPAAFRTSPTPAYTFDLPAAGGSAGKIPRLMAAYLLIGCRICGTPAIDREFKTIDFLTLMDIENIPAAVARKYMI
jgi:putative hemolysin